MRKFSNFTLVRTVYPHPCNSKTDTGGAIEVYNNTGDGIVTRSADDYGDGEVGAWNRKGEGRVWGSQ